VGKGVAVSIAVKGLLVMAREANMPREIKTISVSLPYRLGSVNCYLIETATGYVLIDTGCSNKRTGIEKELESAGCQPGNLKLIVITHGDFDHTGNAAYLRKKFGTKTAMHYDDSGMVERGNMFWNRKKGNILIRTMAPILFKFGKSERFKPDVDVEDGDDLSEYGFDAEVLHIPGHSKGSIGILTGCGNLFCGDLFENTDKPNLNSIMDDLAAANASFEKLKKLNIKTVYPGHGKPFPMELFMKNNR
jgi:hydroxyacylglutathione hydrolase